MISEPWNTYFLVLGALGVIDVVMFVVGLAMYIIGMIRQPEPWVT